MSTAQEEQAEQIDAQSWFNGARSKAMTVIQALKGKKKDEAMNEFLQKDEEFIKEFQNQKADAQEQQSRSFSPPPTAQQLRNPVKVNPIIERDIAEFREKNPEFDKILKGLDRQGKEEIYTVAVLQKMGIDVSDRTQAVQNYWDKNPTFTSRLQGLPDDRLENSIALNKMKEQGYSPQAIVMERFLNRPENAAIKADVLAAVKHIANPDFAKKVALTEKAPAILKQRGIKL